MAKNSIDEQERFLNERLEATREKLNAPTFKIATYLTGSVKNKFINDVLQKKQSVNKISKDIFKFYYDNHPSSMKY